MWVADYEDAKVYAYSLDTKTRDDGKDITTDSTFGRDLDPTAQPCGLPIKPPPRFTPTT